MPKRQLETDYVHALEARAALEIRTWRLFRRNVGAIQVDDRFFRASLPGQCDLYAIGTGGLHAEIECKRFGRLTDKQERWRDWCTEWRVPWLLLTVGPSEVPPVTIDRWMRTLSEFFRAVEAGASDARRASFPPTGGRIA